MAAIPVIVICTADTWIKVATAVLTASIKKKSVNPNVYKITTVPTTGAAPVDDSLAWLAFDGDNTEEISDSAAIDVYMKAVRVNGEVIVVK
jgi:hypothetical protein